MKIKTDFEKLRLNPRRSGFPPHLKNEEVVRDYPQSDEVEGECPNEDCGFRGRAGKYYGWNSYYRCPECEQDIIVSG